MATTLAQDNWMLNGAHHHTGPIIAQKGVSGEAKKPRTQPLTTQDLVAYHRSGCKPREKWRIGVENEKFGFYRNTKRPLEYDTIRQLLEGLAERFGWTPKLEDGHIVGLTKDGKSITLEAGGQFELSGEQLASIHEIQEELKMHIDQVNAVGKDLGIGFVGVGVDPKCSAKDTPVMPKSRYHAMKTWFAVAKDPSQDVMFRTCSVQVNLDFNSEERMVDMLRVSLALQPVATALFANSPFEEGKPSGFLSSRSQKWAMMRTGRTGVLPFVFKNGFGFESYVEWALDVPMLFVHRGGRYIDTYGASFRDFMAGKLLVLPGECATLQDWEYHIGTLYPEVRLKRFIEMRGVDVGPQQQICALSAFWVGLVYDDEALQGAKELVSDWTDEERQILRNKVPKLGLKTPFREGTVQDVAKQAVALSKAGLERRGLKEESFLSVVEETARTGVAPAEKLLEAYNGRWAKDIDHLYDELMY